MLIGVLPGLGPAATIAILPPLTYNVEPVTAIIMLAGIFYGAQYGGTITSVLLRLPGEASSVVTVFDGHALARQGRAGTALGIAAVAGVLLATVGRDDFTSTERFTFGNLSLADGIDFVPVAMGLFGLGEILYNLEERHHAVQAPKRVADVWPSRADLRASSGAIGRGSVIGFVLGVLPGGGATIASLAAYGLEKRRAKQPERFGRGAVEGVAGP